MLENKYAFVGCSSSSKVDNEQFLNEAKKVGIALAHNKYGLVFGACNYGLMGEIYRNMKAHGSSIIGVAPTLYKDDFKVLECDEEYVLDTVNERISLMIDKSDIIIFLTGGTGTLEEIIIAIEMKRRKEIDKPIIIYDETGFYLPLIEQLKSIEKYKFSDNCTTFFEYVTNIEALDQILKTNVTKANILRLD